MGGSHKKEAPASVILALCECAGLSLPEGPGCNMFWSGFQLHRNVAARAAVLASTVPRRTAGIVQGCW